MDNQKYERTLDGAKLLEWMYENGGFSLKAADMIADEMEKGTFDKVADAFAANDRMIIEAARGAGILSEGNHDNALLRILGEMRDRGIQLTEEKVIAVVDKPSCIRDDREGSSANVKV